MDTRMIMPDLASSRSSISFIHALLLLKKCGVSPENIRFLFKGVFENYKGEITGQRPPKTTEIDSSSLIQLDVASASMVDQLPPSLFFAPGKKHGDLEKTELKSRKLFSCFDSAIGKIKAYLEYILLVYDSVFPELSFSEKFVGAFGFPETGWNSEELFFWMILLPGFHQWAGTKKGTEEILSKFLGTKVRIKENEGGENDLTVESQSFLGKKASKLGSDWSLGNRFSECESTFKVIIGPIPASWVRDLLPLGLKKKKLDRILSHCVPGQLRWRIALRLKQREKSFSVGENTPNCVLGYSTYLKDRGFS
jgi:hypothetical protein